MAQKRQQVSSSLILRGPMAPTGALARLGASNAAALSCSLLPGSHSLYPTLRRIHLDAEEGAFPGP